MSKNETALRSFVDLLQSDSNQRNKIIYLKIIIKQYDPLVRDKLIKITSRDVY